MTINVKIGKEKRNEINPMIFGNFLEHIQNCLVDGVFCENHPLSDETGIRQDVLEKCKELNPPIVRFPGGTVTNIYHWQDHIGPVNERKKGNNLIWDGRMCHEFGTAEFVKYCREIGAEPMICINISSGSLQEAADWVEYCNGTGDTYYANLRRSHGYEEPFNVKYWEIGNENYCEPDLGGFTAESYTRVACEYGKYLKLTDHSIRLIFTGHPYPTCRWNRVLLDKVYSMCDYLSMHYFHYEAPDYDEIKKFEKYFLVPMEAILDEYNEKEVKDDYFYPCYKRSAPIKFALNEWNLWYKITDREAGFGLQCKYEWKAALWVAEFLNLLIRHSHHIEIANMAQMVNVMAPIIATEEGSYRQTTFYPLRNFRRECAGYLADVSYECEGLDISATVGEDGSYTVFAVNTLPTPLSLGFEKTVEQISVCHCDDLNLINSMEKDVVEEYEKSPMEKEVEVPPYSISVIKLK